VKGEALNDLLTGEMLVFNSVLQPTNVEQSSHWTMLFASVDPTFPGNLTEINQIED